MADKLKDAEDRMLEAMFATTPIADDGFSKRVVATIRRRMWIRRLALPVAMVIGGGIALKPVSDLAVASTRLLAVMPQELFNVSVEWLPQVQTVALGAMLLVAGLLGARLIED